jgi:histidine ammonia-lyase
VGKTLSIERTRMLLALRINVLAKGYSGISVETLKRVIKAFNKSCLSLVPEKGTVGASGDLAPLSHIALGLMGEGKMWSPKTGIAEAKHVLEENDVEPICLKAKEGLALINGTQFIAALGAECVERAIKLVLQADVISALTIEVLRGNLRHFDADIHSARPHIGQNEVANRLRSILHSEKYPSNIFIESAMHRKVQDPYTFRCIPQVHGCVVDTIRFVKNTMEIELNSATDNPMVLQERDELISGGNFHGQYPSKILDYLAIGIQDLANISERRIDRLMQDNKHIGLPTFLADKEGLNSGFMIAHCTAAALASENKTLCHPSSVDSM